MSLSSTLYLGLMPAGYPFVISDLVCPYVSLVDVLNAYLQRLCDV